VLGEEVVACLTLNSPADYSEEELRSILRVRLAKYIIPAFILLYEEFPLNPNSKIDMVTLRKDAYRRVLALHQDDARYQAGLRSTRAHK
ncbi:MAG: hypothetical protein IJ705_10035, partial [Oscillospiraceae bacterium]|nr:hypothetical protein [Oscillospiraceae bacterium]